MSAMSCDDGDFLRFEIEFQNHRGLGRGRFILPFPYGIDRSLNQYRAAAKHFDVLDAAVCGHHNLQPGSALNVVLPGQLRIRRLHGEFGLTAILSLSLRLGLRLSLSESGL